MAIPTTVVPPTTIAPTTTKSSDVDIGASVVDRKLKIVFHVRKVSSGHSEIISLILCSLCLYLFK